MGTTPPSPATPPCDCPHCGTPWRAYASLFENSPQPMWIFDQDSLRFLEVNGAAVRRYGYSRDEFLRRTVLELSPSRDGEWLRAELRRGTSFTSVPEQHMARDGRRMDVAVSGHPVDWHGRQAWVVAVSPRGALEEEVRFNDARFRLLVEGSDQVLFYVHDLEGRFEYVSPSSLSMLGRTPEELIGATYASTLASGAQADEVQRLTQEALNSGVAQPTYQAHTMHRDGRQLVVEVTEEPVIRGGRVVGLQGFARDVTDRVRAETARRESEERLQAIVHTVTEGLIIVDAGGHITFANPAAERILGMSGRDLLHRPYDDPVWGIMSVDGQPASADQLPFRRVMAADSAVQDIELTIRRPDGTRAIISVNAAPMHDADGTVTGVITSIRDVTGRRRAEQDLAALHARLLAVIDTSPLGIVLLAADRTVHLWNRSAERIFGWSADEVLDRPSPVRGIDGARPVLPDPVSDPLGGTEVQRLARDGRVLSLSTWTARLDIDAGGSAGTLYVFADVSDRKQLEEQLRQAQKMEAVGRLAGGVAHDFNNVLTSILGHADLLLERVTGEAAGVRDDLMEIRRGAERARSLTQQLLAFSRKQIVQPRLLDAAVVARDLWRMLLHLLGENIAVHLESQPDLWPVCVDRGQLEQVLLNLVVNARDAMPVGGSLRIGIRNVTLDREAVRTMPGAVRGDYLCIEVSDTGTGIDPSVKPYIFEPFFTTKELGKGTGLGLATVYGVMAQNEGFVLVDSEPGHGSTFRLFLPRASGEVVEPPAAVAEPVSGGTETILLVEDEPAVRALAQRVLERKGYTVLVAGDGIEALDVARDHGGIIDLVLTDMVMPGMSGRELVGLLLAERPQLSVVYMSGYTDEIIGGTGDGAAGPAFLEKPFAPAALAAAVRGALPGPMQHTDG